MARTKMVDGVVINLTAEEEAALNAEEEQWRLGAFDRAIESLRIDRNHLLAASDWTALGDVPLSDSSSEAWKTYRTALRNLPSGLTTVDEVNSVVWPTAPS